MVGPRLCEVLAGISAGIAVGSGRQEEGGGTEDEGLCWARGQISTVLPGVKLGQRMLCRALPLPCLPGVWGLFKENDVR